MTRTKKFSTLAAVVVIAFMSIYADTVTTFTSQNNTTQSMTVTLNMQSGASLDVVLPPGQAIPTNLNGDQIVSMTVYGAMVPAGANAIVPSPFGGTVTIYWTVINNHDGTQNVVSGLIDPTQVS